MTASSPHRSFWLTQALARERELGLDQPAPPLVGTHETEICIVGGGFTGLWTAIHIKRQFPAMRIALVEADICGGGASGRNTGFVMNWMSKAPILLALCGAQEAVRLMKESEQAVTQIETVCREGGFGEHFRRRGWLWLASNEAQRRAWDGCLETLDRLGLHPFQPIDRAGVAAMTGSSVGLEGVWQEGLATVQPAMLARALRQKLLKFAVKIFEHTPMTGLVRRGLPAVETRHGVIKAKRAVVLALNAWAHEMPDFRRSLFPIAVDLIVTPPIPEKLAELGLDDGLAMSDSRMMLDAWRSTADGRLAISKSNGDFPFAGRLGRRLDDPSPRAAALRKDLLRIYPGLADVPIAESWRGPVARTATGAPFFGRLPGFAPIYYGHGYSGNGVGPSYIGGKILAALALGQKNEWSGSPLAAGPRGAFPPEPIRYLGGLMVRRACAAKDRAEDEGRKPNKLTRALASFAPTAMTVKAEG